MRNCRYHHFCATEFREDEIIYEKMNIVNFCGLIHLLLPLAIKGDKNMLKNIEQIRDCSLHSV